MEIQIRDNDDLVLWIGKGDVVQVPMDKNERAQCRKMLLDALSLLDQTIVKYCTSSMGGAKDLSSQQSPQHLSDCLGVYDFSPPSKQPTGNSTHKLQLVSVDPL